jgi:hypothetical protein
MLILTSQIPVLNNVRNVTISNKDNGVLISYEGKVGFATVMI